MVVTVPETVDTLLLNSKHVPAVVPENDSAAVVLVPGTAKLVPMMAGAVRDPATLTLPGRVVLGEVRVEAESKPTRRLEALV